MLCLFRYSEMNICTAYSSTTCRNDCGWPTSSVGWRMAPPITAILASLSTIPSSWYWGLEVSVPENIDFSYTNCLILTTIQWLRLNTFDGKGSRLPWILQLSSKITLSEMFFFTFPSQIWKSLTWSACKFSDDAFNGRPYNQPKTSIQWHSCVYDILQYSKTYLK